MKRANSSHKMVGRCGLEPQMYLTSRIYSALPSPLGYLPIKGRWSNFFITWYASLIGVLCLWYSTGIRLLSTCCTSPQIRWVAPKRPDASGYYMLRHSYPPSYCAYRNYWHNLLGLEPISSSFGDWRFTN